MHTSQHSSTSRVGLPRLRLLPQRNTFTAQEVRRRLLERESDDPRTLAVHGAAARTAIWSSLLSEKVAFDLGRTANRLPTVVFWHAQGVDSEGIGRRLSPFGGAWDAERALDVAASLIARTLNQARVPREVHA